ncbi:2-nitropropane dioxygenase [Rhodobacterales bacterium HKCCE2091]|nr:2-nitropropane dioxygenase [Rhodobacterales bacterium HKCCE2091]
MWPDTRLTTLFGTEHPIVQAPMLGSSGPLMAAEVSRAGALGSVPCGDLPADEVEARFDRLRQMTDRPVNLNFFVHPGVEPTPVPAALAAALEPWRVRFGLDALPGRTAAAPAPFGPERAALVVRLRPEVVSFHFNLPGPAEIATLKRAGIVTMASAPTVADAMRIAAAGIDVVIAQGWEAGGHRGAPGRSAPGDGVGTIALVPQIVDAVDIPVIAAGGIADGRGIAATLTLGAAGVQIGTAFLRCPESEIGDDARQRLADATDTDTAFTTAFSGGTARGIRSAYSTDLARHVDEIPGFPAMYDLSNPLRAAAATAGDDGMAYQLYGQAAALARDVPAGDLVAALVRETRALLPVA